MKITRNVIVKARDIDSEVTGMSTGHPIRVLRNAMSREYLKLEKEGAGFEELEQLTLGSLRKAVMDGDVVHGSLMAGQCAGLGEKRTDLSGDDRGTDGADRGAFRRRRFLGKEERLLGTHIG